MKNYNLSCRTGFIIGLLVATAYFELLSGTRTIQALSSLHRIQATLQSSAVEPSSAENADLQAYKAKINATTIPNNDSETAVQQEIDVAQPLESDRTQPEKIEGGPIPLQPVEKVMLDPQSVWDHNKLVFIHIGKSGGSSARCMLETGLGEGTCKDGKFLKSLNFRDEYTAIYNHTVALCHQLSCVADDQWRMNYPEAAKPADWFVMNFPGAIVSVRNPVDRILSWYLYGRAIFQSGNFGSGDDMQVYLCYPEFFEAAEAVRNGWKISSDQHLTVQISLWLSINTPITRKLIVKTLFANALMVACPALPITTGKIIITTSSHS
jgi:hypothetical protein